MVALDFPKPGPSILIADDDETCRVSLRDVFRPRGYLTYLAGSGREAIEIVRRQLIHVVIMDVEMPEITGLEALQAIRSTRREYLPCILVTGMRSDKLRMQALEMDASTLLYKPLDVGLVRYTVDRLMARYYKGPPVGPAGDLGTELG